MSLVVIMKNVKSSIILFMMLFYIFNVSFAAKDRLKIGRDGSVVVVKDEQIEYKKKYLLNVSFDPTRKIFKEINEKFSANHLKKTNNKLYIHMSHGGSGKQSRSVIDGLGAEVITLALASDIDRLAKTGHVKEQWRAEFPNDSSPYSSTIVFLVRKGNPKNIQDWVDLVRKDVKVVTPNPKTSGGARWNYLAAWAYAKEKLGSDFAAEDFIFQLYRNVPILDTTARNSTISFVRREIGDALISWESEAHLALEEIGSENFEIIYPSISIKAELPVAIVEKVTQRRNNRDLAKKYLDYLYSAEAQKIIAKNHYRPVNEKIMKKYAHKYPKMKIVKVQDLGTWEDLNYLHFSNKGIFDKIYR